MASDQSFIGRAVVAELVDNGHEVTGLARSDESAAVVSGQPSTAVTSTISRRHRHGQPSRAAPWIGPYVGDGANRWPVVHRFDAARLPRLGLENATTGTLLHAVAEEGIAFLEIAEALVARLGVRAESVAAEQIADEIPVVGRCMAADVSASSAVTCELLGWEPTGPTAIGGHRGRPLPPGVGSASPTCPAGRR